MYQKDLTVLTVHDIPISEQIFKRFITFINSCINGNSVCNLAVRLPLSKDGWRVKSRSHLSAAAAHFRRRPADLKNTGR
jgi:hypothetical protein